MRECELKTGVERAPRELSAGESGQLCKDETRARCAVCGITIERRLHALPVCGARDCRRAWLGRTAAASQRAIDARLHEVVSAAARALPEAPVAALLPANTRAMEPVTPALRDRFVASIRRRLVDYPLAVAPPEPRAHQDPGGGHALALHALLLQGCATCGGACCTRGGTHAFLSAAGLRGTAEAQTDGDTGAALETLYTAHLPATHYAGSCVFHGERGCTLPRALRSDTCNRYLCGELTALSRALTGADGERAVVGAATWSSLERVAVIDALGAEQLPLPAIATTFDVSTPA